MQALDSFWRVTTRYFEGAVLACRCASRKIVMVFVAIRQVSKEIWIVSLPPTVAQQIADLKVEDVFAVNVKERC